LCRQQTFIQGGIKHRTVGHSEPKRHYTLACKFVQMPIDFWNSFVERFSNKFPTESPPKIPSDFRRVPTLPREIAGPYDTRWPIARVYAPLCIGLDENRFARARVHRVVYDARRLLLRTFVAQLLLHVCHGQWLSCATSCATHI